MAEADPLKRIKSAALRSEGPVSVETQRRRHFDELNQDFGLDAETQRRRAYAARPSRWPSLTRIIAYLMLFTLLMITAMTIRLWYDGTLSRFITTQLPHAPTQTGWMLKHDDDAATTPPARDEAPNANTPLPSFIDPLPTPPPAAPAASRSEDSSDPSESQDDSNAQ